MRLSERDPVGIIFRVFAKKEEQIPEILQSLEQAINQVLRLKVNGKPAFKIITVMVPVNKKYPNHDCGKTADEIRKRWGTKKRLEVVETSGDLFCATLNQGVAHQAIQHKVKYSLIASPNIQQHLTETNIFEMFRLASQREIKVVGLAIGELFKSIHHEGRIANTCALWDNEALLSVGGFNLLAAEQEDDKSTHYLKGLDEDGKDRFYPIHGMEEVIPLALLVERFGGCIGTVVPEGQGEYVLPSDPEIKERHLQKMATKKARQNELLSKLGFHPSILWNGIYKS